MTSSTIIRRIWQGMALLSVAGPAVVLYCFMYAPWRSLDHSGLTQERELSGLGNDLGRAHQELLSAREQLEQYRSRAALMRQRIPDVPGEAEFLNQLTDIADATGLKIQNYQPGSLTVKECYSQLPIRLSCTATYTALCRFLDQLKEIPRIFTVETMTIESRPGDEAYVVGLNFWVYFRQPPQS